MGLFGSRKKSLWDTINGLDPDTQGTGTAAYIPETESPASTPVQPHHGFDWGSAALGFFGGSGVATQIHDQHEKRDQAEALAQLGYDPAGMKALQSSPTALASVLASRYQQRQPANNDTVADYHFIEQTLGPDAAKKYLGNKVDPPRYMEVENPATGEKRIIPVSSGGQPEQGGRQGPPPQAIARLLQNPHEAELFDSKYGAGASRQILGAGGAGQSGPQTFRPGLFGARPY